ncbi:toxin-antitoxin system [Enterococcus sp. AZ109]|uniref:toxin-antitoxin system n=1 Tax=Enterococcus sp. AZ109 TaxID=2774634 RepID=UPI003F1F9F32
MQTKTRKQGNSITLTVPKEFKIGEGVTMKPKLYPTGIFYEFVTADDEYLDFDTEILKDLISEGAADDYLVSEFARRKKEIPQALQKIKEETVKNEPIMSREELEKEIGL